VSGNPKEKFLVPDQCGSCPAGDEGRGGGTIFSSEIEPVVNLCTVPDRNAASCRIGSFTLGKEAIFPPPSPLFCISLCYISCKQDRFFLSAYALITQSGVWHLQSFFSPDPDRPGIIGLRHTQQRIFRIDSFMVPFSRRHTSFPAGIDQTDRHYQSCPAE